MADNNNGNFTEKSLTKEVFEDKMIPVLNIIAELMLSHPDIPEDVDQHELLGTLTTVTTELRNEVNGRVPEIVSLQEDIAKKNKQIQKLQETNQQLYLKVGTYTDPNKKPDGDPQAPPKKSYEEIKKMLENL